MLSKQEYIFIHLMKNGIPTFCLTKIVSRTFTKYENEKKKFAVLAQFTTAAGCETFISTFGVGITQCT
jgi:hypothetical protein